MKANISKQAVSAAVLFFTINIHAAAQKVKAPQVITMSVDSCYTVKGKRLKKHYTYSYVVNPKPRAKKEAPALAVADK